MKQGLRLLSSGEDGIKTAALVHFIVKTAKETQVTGLAFTLTEYLMWPKHMGSMFFCLYFFYTPAKQIPQN